MHHSCPHVLVCVGQTVVRHASANRREDDVNVTLPTNFQDSDSEARSCKRRVHTTHNLSYPGRCSFTRKIQNLQRRSYPSLTIFSDVEGNILDRNTAATSAPTKQRTVLSSHDLTYPEIFPALPSCTIRAEQMPVAGACSATEQFFPFTELLLVECCKVCLADYGLAVCLALYHASSCMSLTRLSTRRITMINLRQLSCFDKGSRHSDAGHNIDPKTHGCLQTFPTNMSPRHTVWSDKQLAALRCNVSRFTLGLIAH